MTGKIEHQHPTKCICHKGLTEGLSIIARSNFRTGGQITSPQSLTAHTLDRWVQCYFTDYTTLYYREN